jgi:hypothetical protein
MSSFTGCSSTDDVALVLSRRVNEKNGNALCHVRHNETCHKTFKVAYIMSQDFGSCIIKRS